MNAIGVLKIDAEGRGIRVSIRIGVEGPVGSLVYACEPCASIRPNKNGPVSILVGFWLMRSASKCRMARWKTGFSGVAPITPIEQ